MFYSNTKIGTFLSRPNRFLAHVMVDGKEVVCHVKNTGRLRELLIPGVSVAVQFHPDAAETGRKTEYSLIAVEKPMRHHSNKAESPDPASDMTRIMAPSKDLTLVNIDSQAPIKDFTWVNIDSQAPNQVAYEWLTKLASESAPTAIHDFNISNSFSASLENHIPETLLHPKNIRREVRYGGSRFDLSFTNEADGGKPWLMEVKGVTLDVDGTAMFPDAPTERGVKHLEELTNAAENGFGAAVLFVIQMKGISAFAPHAERHPAFAEALANAARRGVHVWAYDCVVKEDSLQIDAPVPVLL